MPEPSDSDREKAARLPDWFASSRLVEALERDWEIHFRCQYCGASRTWRRDVMLGRAQKALGFTMAEIQRRARCSRCQAPMPIMSMTGVRELGGHAPRARDALIHTLLDAGLNPADYGYGWRRREPIR